DGRAPIKPAQAVEGGIEGQPADDADRMRIGERRTVAMEIRQNVEPRREVFAFGCPQFADPPGYARVKRPVRLAARPVPADDMVEQRAGGGLPGFRKPEIRQRYPVIRAPDSGKWSRIGRYCHHAA